MAHFLEFFASFLVIVLISNTFIVANTLSIKPQVASLLLLHLYVIESDVIYLSCDCYLPVLIIFMIAGHLERIWNAAWNPSGTLLASCGADKTISTYSTSCINI